MKKMLIPIIAVVVIGVGVAAYFLLFAGGDDTVPEIVLAAYNTGESYVTNVKGSGKLFRAGVYLMVDEAMMTDLSEKTSPTIPLIRDTILFVFRDLTEEEITADDAREVIGQNIVDAINERLGVNEPDAKGKAQPKVHSTLFTDFVIS